MDLCFEGLCLLIAWCTDAACVRPERGIFCQLCYLVVLQLVVGAKVKML